MVGHYHSGYGSVPELEAKAYTDKTIKDKIPDIGLTCAFFNAYPLTFTKRYISKPMLIPKAEFMRILEE